MAINSEQGYQEAQKRIAAAKLRDATHLNLGNLALTAVPPEIGSLTALQTLYADNNQLTTLPPEIGSLTALRTLRLDINHFSTLPPAIGALIALERIDLDRNQLTALPPEIGSLTALQTLWLHSNRFTALPPEIGSLIALQKLSLHSNQLTALPPELAHCGELQQLFLHANEGLEIPASVLGPNFYEVYGDTQKKRPARPIDILNFYFSRQSASAEGTLKAVNELKVMLVGRGGAGKTSLRRFFLDQPHDTREPETPGIALDDFTLPCHGSVITVHLWDFAGQEITHALHQFFLTEGCVYILVLDPRSNTEMTDAFYWLDQLARYSPASPVIVAMNRQDARQGGYDIDRDLLKERYPQIQTFVKTNCETRFGCGDLHAALTKTIEALKPTEPPRLEVPVNWLEVKDECWSMAGKRAVRHPTGIIPAFIQRVSGNPSENKHYRHTLTFTEFSTICEHHRVHTRERQESLARLLHKLGAVLHFVDDARLRDTSVLNPHWVTDGVYRLLRFKDRPKSDGILSIKEAAEALEDKSEESARYLLGLMERFEMCFPVDEDMATPTRWLIPGALNPYQPEGLGQSWQGAGAVRLRYDYGAPVAEGILPRFIVLTHPLRGEALWRNGVVLRDGEAAAMIRRGEKANHIEVAAFGPETSRLCLLELIQGTMDRVNADLPGPPPVVEKEMKDLPGVYRSIAELKAAELTETRIVVASTPPPVLVEPTPQLNRVSEPESRDPSRVPLNAFLSYSHDDRSAKNIFAMNLNVMQNKNLITPWHDGMIEIGKEWKKEIDAQLESMDLFVGLLTTSFLASRFIQEIELMAARERLREREGREFLFVLILVDDISLDGLDLAQYQLVIPGDRPICKHKSRKDGFNQAQKEIEKLIKQHKSRRNDSDGRVGVPVELKTRIPSDVMGAKQMSDDHRINIVGDVINSQVGQTLTNCTNLVQQQAPGERKELLGQLCRDVELLIERFSEEKQDEAPQVAEDLEMFVKQATSEKPNRRWYSVSTEGLLEASKWVKDFSGNIAGTLLNLGKKIWGADYQLPDTPSKVHE